MANVIIGIHGLGNKPEKKLLENWWIESINEGLQRIHSPLKKFKFEMVYWADVVHPVPESPFIDDREDELYLNEPYMPASQFKATPQKKISLSEKFIRYIGSQLDRIFLKDDMTLNFVGVTNRIIRKYFKDLQMYFSNELITGKGENFSVRWAISDRLISVLKKHQKDKIILLAHSMGSIIAYDVLIHNTHLKIDTFITFGSPLGLPIITSRLYEEKKNKSSLTAPDNILTKWYNLADLRDYVALDYTLGDDFIANKNGLIAEDIKVINDYHSGEAANAHKSFGYLRCHEMAAIINDFYKKKPGLLFKPFILLTRSLKKFYTILKWRNS